MIEVNQLTKRYGPLTAVDQLSFSVKPGEVLGFLGPNGAGKTTTMRMIVGAIAVRPVTSVSPSPTRRRRSTEAAATRVRRRAMGPDFAVWGNGSKSGGEVLTIGS